MVSIGLSVDETKCWVLETLSFQWREDALYLAAALGIDKEQQKGLNEAE